MIAALILLILSAFGITPSDEELAAYENSYWNRIHHVFVELGSAVDDTGIDPTFSLGYEALLDRGGRGASFEIVGESIGVPFGEDTEYFLGAGGGHYLLPKLHVSIAAGPLFRPNEDVLMRGRLDIALRLLIFSVAVHPYIRVMGTSDGTVDFGFGGRFEY